jgi:hypothetical protein
VRYGRGMEAFKTMMLAVVLAGCGGGSDPHAIKTCDPSLWEGSVQQCEAACANGPSDPAVLDADGNGIVDGCEVRGCALKTGVEFDGELGCCTRRDVDDVSTAVFIPCND